MARFISTTIIVLAMIGPTLGPVSSVADALPIKDLPVRAGLPEALVTDDGHAVTTAGEWEVRRTEMKRVLEDYEFGHTPPTPGNVKGDEVESKLLQNGQVLFRQVHLTFGPGRKLGFDLCIFAPVQTNAVKARFPTIIHLAYTIGESTVGQYVEALRRGYQVVEINYQQLGADNSHYRQSAFFPAYPGYDWRDMAAWAWGVSRCVDFLEQDPATDKSKIILVGHSRVAQAAQLAGAMDERIALVGAAGCGCAFRFCGKGHGGKQGLDEVIRQNTFWFGPRLPEFLGQVDKLPFDQHWMIALAAPRPFILCNALDDQYCNGNAIVQSYLAVKRVYAMLGVPENLGIVFRPGHHALLPEDWQAILDFSDWQLRKRDVKRRFDELPPASELH